MRTILVDDDESNLSVLSEKLAKHCPQVEIIAKCDNGEDAIQSIDAMQPDIVFLDIEMPVMNGFLMLQQLIYKKFSLIFVTAYDHYAIKAIRYSALDYLVKPVAIPDLINAVAKASENHSRQQSQVQIELLLEHFNKKKQRRITIPTNEGLQFINMDDIVYLEASDNYTNIFLEPKRKFLVSRTLKSFEDLLPVETFVRIHHATIINKGFVDNYLRGDGGQVTMRNGSVLDVSKRKKTEFLQAMGF
jgi:two-component system LytT family response regulator